MAQQNINIGTVANDGTGDDLRVAMQKVNDNFTELYGASPVTAQITISGNQISSNTTNANLKLTASGTGVIEFEGVQIRDNHIEATRTNDDLVLGASGTGDIVAGAIRVHGTTISSDDSTKITFNEAVDVTGTLTAPIIDVNVLQSSDSSAIQINENLNVNGIVSTTTLDTSVVQSSDSSRIRFLSDITVDTVYTNAILSEDSSAVQIADSVNISGTLTVAGGITGVTTLTNSQITDGSVTHSGSSGQQPLDTFATNTYRSAKYIVSISDSTNTRYAIDEIYVTHDSTNAYISSVTTSSTGSALVTYSADISGPNVRVLMVPISSDSVTYKYVRTAIDI